jgi:hypothetical protein
MSDISHNVENALSSGDRVVAYMVGQRYPRFAGCSRELLAQVFEGHGYAHTAKQLRDGAEARKCLQAVISRRGKSRCLQLSRKLSNGNGTKRDVTILPLDADNPDVKSFGIYFSERRPGERSAAPVVGARVYASPDGSIRSAPPVDSSEHPDCRALADECASDAINLLTACEVVDVSSALCDAYAQASALPFLGKGSYLVQDNESGRQLVALLDDLRAQFYDEDKRSGIRCRAVKVTESDRAAVSDAVVDDIERRAAELAGLLRDYAGRDKGLPHTNTLGRRRQEAEELLRQIGAQRELIGAWSGRFEKQAEALRLAFDRAVGGQVLELPSWFDAESPAEPASAPQAPVPAAAPVAPAPVVAVAPCKPIGEPKADSDPDPDLAAFNV